MSDEAPTVDREAAIRALHIGSGPPLTCGACRVAIDRLINSGILQDAAKVRAEGLEDWSKSDNAELRQARVEGATEIRAKVEAVVTYLSGLAVDHRHPGEKGAGSEFGVDGRAYYYAGDIIDGIVALRAALADSRAVAVWRGVKG